MTVGELSRMPEFEVICMPNEDREILGGYAGDLLSWVMGRAKEGDAWITIMSNVNIVAVSTLVSPACIILSEGVVPDDATKARAEEQGVNILTTMLDTFSVSAKLATLL